MTGLRATPSALRAHATHCGGLAADLDAGQTALPAGPAHQATAAAVAALHTTVGATTAAMATRMRSTAAAVQCAAAAFDEQDAGAATALGSLHR